MPASCPLGAASSGRAMAGRRERRPARPGPQPRAAARRTLAAEPGEHGENPPFPRRPAPGLEPRLFRGGTRAWGCEPRCQKTPVGPGQRNFPRPRKIAPAAASLLREVPPTKEPTASSGTGGPSLFHAWRSIAPDVSVRAAAGKHCRRRTWPRLRKQPGPPAAGPSRPALPATPAVRRDGTPPPLASCRQRRRSERKPHQECRDRRARRRRGRLSPCRNMPPPRAFLLPRGARHGRGSAQGRAPLASRSMATAAERIAPGPDQAGVARPIAGRPAIAPRSRQTAPRLVIDARDKL